jgi:hypothetical protein
VRQIAIMTGNPLPVRLRGLVLPGALLAAAALVVVLGIELRAARAELQAEKRKAMFPDSGQVVPAVHARTLNGDSVLLGEGAPGTRQVLFIFNTTCSICVSALPGWERVSGALAGDAAVSVLAWSQDVDSLTQAYVERHRLPFRVVVGLPVKYLALYRGLGVPTTLVLDADGMVIYGRSGVLSRGAEDSAVMYARDHR